MRGDETAWRSSNRGPFSFASVGVCAYLALFGLPAESNLSLIVLAAAAGLSTLYDARRARWTNPFWLPLVLFVVSTAASTVASTDPLWSLRMSVPLLPGLLLFLLISEYLSGRQVELVFLTLSLVGFGLAVAVLWTVARSAAHHPDLWVEEVPSMLLVVKNDVALFAILLPFSFALVTRTARRVAVVLGGVSMVAGIAAAIAFQSRGALIAGLVALGVFGGLVRPRLALFAVAAGLLLGLVVDGLLGFALTQRFSGTIGTRIPIWMTAGQMFADAPLLGKGPHAFGLHFEDYFRRLELPAWIPREPRFSPWAHNLYLELLAEQGLPGLGALLWLLARSFSISFAVQRTGEARQKRLGGAALAALAAFCTAATYELSFLRLWVVIVFFTILGVIAALLRETREGPDRPALAGEPS